MKILKRFVFRLIIISLLISQLMLTLSGCKATADNLPHDDVKDKIRIGFAMATIKEDRWIRDRDIFAAKAKQAGYDVIITNANNDTEQQYKQVEELVRQGIDVLVFIPQDCNTAARCTSVAKKAGIPVISYDRLVRNADVDVYVSFNNVKVGELQGKALVGAVPKGGYIILNGSPTDNNSRMFNEGYMNELKSYIDAGQIDIVGETWVENWTRETAFDFTSQVLKKDGGKITGIIAANDSLAWAAIDALSEARLTEKVKVVGHDADLAACQRIVSGTQLMTVYKPIKNLVEKTVELCGQLAENKKFEYTEKINDGTYDVPYIMIDVVAVTKDNVDDTVIKDGFHLREDVYRNQKQESSENP